MPFFKQVEKKDAQEKYGFSHQGIFAKEAIKRGEAIFTCDLSICDYLKIENVNSSKTKEETIQIMNTSPEIKDFIHKYCYMMDDDLFDWPRKYKDLSLVEDCMFFNHSCDPNCGFQAIDESLVVAIRDIEIGEELTYDYQCMDTEASFYTGIDCKCGTNKCRGVLKFDQYRNVDWQNKLYKYSGGYVKRKIDELKTKWYSSSCYLKNYNQNNNEERLLGLTALEKINKHEMVAKFFDATNINEHAHYILHSDKPTCYLVGNEVFSAQDIEPETQLTLDYNKNA